MSPVRIQYQLTKAEFLMAMTAMWAQKKQSTRAHLVWGGAGLVTGAVLYFLVAPWAGVAAGLIGVFLLLLAAVRPMLFGLAYDKTPEYTQGLTMVFAEDGIFIESGKKKSKLSWNKVSRFAPTGDFLFLYLKSRNFIVVPMSAFTDPADIEQVQRLVKNKI